MVEEDEEDQWRRSVKKINEEEEEEERVSLTSTYYSINLCIDEKGLFFFDVDSKGKGERKN